MKDSHKSDQAVQNFGKVVTAFFLIGWGIGGLYFGSLGDKFGRARMLTITILIYSVFTGLSFFSQSRFDFTLFRFLTGVGVGGVFGLAVALIAETVPPAARAAIARDAPGAVHRRQHRRRLRQEGGGHAGASNAVAAGNGWRWMFLVGAIPAMMVIITGRCLRGAGAVAQAQGRGAPARRGASSPLTRSSSASRRWRKNLVVGALIASTGVVGLWAIGEYAVDLQRQMLRNYFGKDVPRQVVTREPGQTDQQVEADQVKLDKVRNLGLDKQGKPVVFRAYILNMLGAGLGMWLFTRLAAAAGRRFAFLCGFSAALVVTVFVYWKMKTPSDAYWMMPLMGAAQLSVFAGFAIYLPELFPSALRSTGTSFCYNLGRFAAAGGSFVSAYLSDALRGVFAPGDTTSTLPFRFSAIIMCSLFLIGLLTLPFAPETKGKPLPE